MRENSATLPPITLIWFLLIKYKICRKNIKKKLL